MYVTSFSIGEEFLSYLSLDNLKPPISASYNTDITQGRKRGIEPTEGGERGKNKLKTAIPVVGAHHISRDKKRKI